MMRAMFHKGVLIYSISPRVCGVAWLPPGWQLNLSIGLNQFELINLYVNVDN